MSNLRYYNQAGPFWDFIAGLEGKDWSNHPFASAYTGPNNQNNETNEVHESNDESETEKEDVEEAGPDPESGAENNHPWGWGWGGPHFGGRGGRGRHGRGPPGGFGRHGPPPPPFDGAGPSRAFEHRGPPPTNEEEHQAPPPPEEEEGRGKRHAGPHHRGHGAHGSPSRGPGGPHRREHGRGGHCGGPNGRGGRGGFGAGRGRGRGPAGWGRGGNPFDMSNIAEFFQTQIFGGGEATKNFDGSAAATNGDFVPPVDIFDTESAFVIHVSLPGAKKEDIAVNWDAEKSEVSITGVIHRPGDEEFLKTLALDERKVGAFERKVRLGSRANPAPVDAEGISAKLEDGILRLHVPKEDKEFDVIHKVDVE